jgi:hypothetical protein
MILESFLIKNTKLVEKFEDTDTAAKAGNIFVGIIVFAVVFAIFYTGGAVSLSLNYNNYVGTSSGLKIFYAILVLFFPSLYYPFYAWFLSPVSKFKSRNISMNGGPRI